MNKQLRQILDFLNPFNLIRVLRFGLMTFNNWRRGRYKKLDAIIFKIPAEMPALPEKRSFIQRQISGEPPMSLYELDEAFQRVGDDARVKAVILLLSSLQMGLADLQTLRDSIQRLRAAGKRVVAYAQAYNTAEYYVACACDDILLQPTGELFTLGLARSFVYQADALDALGIKAEAFAITPYKSAAERQTQNQPSPEALAQANWLLDSQFAQITSAMHQARHLSGKIADDLIDDAPHHPAVALERGYITAVLHEEDIPAHVGVAHMMYWKQAEKKLLKQWRRREAKYIAVLRVGGLIVPGESGKPPIDPPIDIPFVGGERAGDLTVVQQVRALQKDENAAAVILFVDSPGGSGFASEAMANALRQLAKTRPVITYMHNVAASGGYYIATPTQRIIAQPGTITGSIGVISMTINTDNAYKKLRLNRVTLQRGKNANLLSDAGGLTDEQRAKMRDFTEYFYAGFLALVAENRGKTAAEIDPIAGGRVWMGEQAIANGLIDELGGLEAAVRHVRTAAELPEHVPVKFVRSKGKPIPPQVAEQANPAAWMRYAIENAQMVYGGHVAYILPFTSMTPRG